MPDIEKIHEANVILLRIVDDETIVDVAIALAERIPRFLDGIDPGPVAKTTTDTTVSLTRQISCFSPRPSG